VINQNHLIEGTFSKLNEKVILRSYARLSKQVKVLIDEK
jgi:hypothetical protein